MNKLDKLKGKKVLLFAPYTFNYQNIIFDKLKQLGAETFLYDERAITKAIDKALLKIEPYIFKNKTREYYSQIIQKHSGEEFDYILVIKCDMPTNDVLEDLQKAFAKAKMCLHIWDSVNNIPHILDKVHNFYRATSFDRKDCEAGYGFDFRPLFFADEFSQPQSKTDYEYAISFCGTIHSDRYRVLKEVKKQCEQQGMKYYGFHYLQSKFVYYLYRATKSEFRGTQISCFALDKKPSSEIAEIVNNSLAVVDIQHPKQTGLTMRTIEMLGMHKKFITTNKDVINYDFYNPNNICVIDREKPVITKEFLNTPYQAVSEEIYQKYTLEWWICDVLGV